LIEARPWPAFSRAFAWLADRKLRAAFDSAHVRGLETLADASDERPTIVVANHSSWWDGMVAIWLHHHLGRGDAYALMNAGHLSQNLFFTRIGAVGIDLDDPRDGARFLRWAKQTLAGRSTTLWVFPQGRELPGNPRPFHFQGGAAALARILPEARVLPVALDYLFVGSERPRLFVNVGDPLPHSTQTRIGAAHQGQAVEALLDQIAWLADDGQLSPSELSESGFQQIFGPRLGPTRPGLATRLLSRMTRGSVASQTGSTRGLPSASRG
jgi:1-acyl-sn-glycerol-3-phosphate acyltransferase